MKKHRQCLARLRLCSSSDGGAAPNVLTGGAASASPPEEPKPFCTYGGGARICGFAALAPAPATEHCGRSPAKHGLNEGTNTTLPVGIFKFFSSLRMALLRLSSLGVFLRIYHRKQYSSMFLSFLLRWHARWTRQRGREPEKT